MTEDGGHAARRAAASSVHGLFQARVRVHPDRLAAVAGMCAARGVGRGVTIAAERAVPYEIT